MAAHYSADATLTSSDLCRPQRGADALERIHRGLFELAPDVHDDLIDIIVQGDNVAVRFVSSGHIRREAFELEIGDFFRVENGLIVQDNTIFNTNGRPCED